MSAVDQSFADDVKKGLCGNPKQLPCEYFYDNRGFQLFEDICLLPEYYCTRAEESILRDRAEGIAAVTSDPVQVVELGSGTSAKTRWLLKALLEARERVVYRPIDICRDVLTVGASELKAEFPRLVVKPIVARYEEGLQALDTDDGGILLLWLGSSIGNLGRGEAATFLADLRVRLRVGDLMLIGIDLIKNLKVLEAAYNDKAGVTAAFNLNLLARINRELGGDFDLKQFRHVAFYNVEESRIEMYLESCRDQLVSIANLDTKVSFKAGERIHTENSYKYDLDSIEALVNRAGLRQLNQWFDLDGFFSLNLISVDDRDAGS